MATLKLPGFKERLGALWAAYQRAHPGVTQRQFAKDNRIDQQSFSEFLRGSTPSFENLERLAAAFGTTWQALLVGTGAEDQVIALEEDHDVAQLAAHARRAFADVLSRVGDGDRAEIIGHLKGQINLLARLAAAIARPGDERTAKKKVVRGPLRRDTGT